MNHWKQVLAGAALAVLLAPGTALAQKANTLVVDGDDWMSATYAERRAFLVGVANMIVAESAYAKRRDTPPAPAGERIVKATESMKIADIESRITRWYEANPAKRAMPVMGVVWQDIVKNP